MALHLIRNFRDLPNIAWVHAVQGFQKSPVPTCQIPWSRSLWLTEQAKYGGHTGRVTVPDLYQGNHGSVAGKLPIIEILRAIHVHDHDPGID